MPNPSGNSRCRTYILCLTTVAFPLSYAPWVCRTAVPNRHTVVVHRHVSGSYLGGCYDNKTRMHNIGMSLCYANDSPLHLTAMPVKTDSDCDPLLLTGRGRTYTFTLSVWCSSWLLGYIRSHKLQPKPWIAKSNRPSPYTIIPSQYSATAPTSLSLRIVIRKLLASPTSG